MICLEAFSECNPQNLENVKNENHEEEKCELSISLESLE
jgi:hypothetical protein